MFDTQFFKSCPSAWRRSHYRLIPRAKYACLLWWGWCTWWWWWWWRWQRWTGLALLLIGSVGITCIILTDLPSPFSRLYTGHVDNMLSQVTPLITRAPTLSLRESPLHPRSFALSQCQVDYVECLQFPGDYYISYLQSRRLTADVIVCYLSIC